MTITTPTEPQRDAKAGFCARCRNSDHVLCASPPNRCACPNRNHPNRPAATVAPIAPAAGSRDESPLAEVRDRARATRSPATGSGAGPAKPVAAKLREPVWELVRADPPAPPPRKPKHLTVIERARPFIEELVAQGNREWWRFAVCPGTQRASQVRSRIAKAYPEFEFKAVKIVEVGQSALYGRWTGQKPKGLL